MDTDRTEQLALLADDAVRPASATWRLDEATRNRGRRGVAAARQALAEAEAARAAEALALVRGQRKQRKALTEAEAKAKRDARYAARKARH